jgi:hypothetical protein
MVRYGASAPEKTAFTKNLSESGAFLQTNKVLPPGSTMLVEIQFPERTWSLWARVIWAKQVPPQLAHILECGMGIQFIDPGTDFENYFRKWKMKLGLD